jgi:hypothetical protein
MNQGHVIKEALASFRQYQELGEKALAQVNDEAFFRTLDRDTNSLAVIVKHMAGNMRSRWRDFLTSDGEKPDRHRDTEFVASEADTREALMRRWEEGWALVFEAVGSLTPEDLARTVAIRSEPYTVIGAINRQLTHYAYHVGQMILLARYWTGERWTYLSVPPGRSESFNREMKKRHGESGSGDRK